MKKIIAISVASATLIAAYFLVRNCSCAQSTNNELTPHNNQRHLTNAFSKAKQAAE